MRKDRGDLEKNPRESAEQWLECLQMPQNSIASSLDRSDFSNIQESFVLRGLQIHLIDRGRISCTFKVPQRLADKSGAWHVGAITTLMDNVGAAAIMSCDLPLKVSVDLNISYISAAKVNDEIEIDARVLGHKGGLSTVVVDFTNKATTELVAQGRQWMLNPNIVTRTLRSKI